MFTQISRYDILGTLGQGNMATVYRARDPHLDRQLAIKVLREDRHLDDNCHSRFLREAKLAGTLTHPNIVTIYDAGEINNQPYIAMEFLDGTPLDEIVARPGSLSLVKILKLGIQLAEALAFAHEKNIIHRDIKPSNIILSNDGNTAKITDFGIARILASGATRHTQIGSILGTPQYMSPEQIRGEQLDASSDLFSLGIILYQLICGYLPFKADNLPALLLAIATKEPLPMKNADMEIPGEVKTLIHKLLAGDNKQRYRSGRELATALRHALDVINPPTLELSYDNRKNPFIRLMAPATLMCALFFSAWSYHSSDKQALVEQHQTQLNDSIARMYAKNMAEPLLTGDIYALQVLAKELSQKHRIGEVVITSRENNILTDNRNEHSSLNISPGETNNAKEYKVHYSNQRVGSLYVVSNNKTGKSNFDDKLYIATMFLIAGLILLSIFLPLNGTRVRRSTI